ncbi:MAG: hypothetical protein AB7T06_39265 [Kofleriaceae bacterium]
MKKTFALFGLLGLVGCFLPMVFGISLWDAREADALQVYLIMAAFAVPMFLGFADKIYPAASLISAACFGYVLWKFGLFGTKDLIIHGSIGGILMGVATIAGLLVSIGSLADKPARA